MATRLFHIFPSVSNLERSIKFYTEAFEDAHMANMANTVYTDTMYTDTADMVMAGTTAVGMDIFD